MPFPIFSLNKALLSYRECLEQGAPEEILARKREKINACFKILGETHSCNQQFSILNKAWSRFVEGAPLLDALNDIINWIPRLHQRVGNRPDASNHCQGDTQEASPDEIKGWKENEFIQKFFNLAPGQQTSFLQFHFGFDTDETQMLLRPRLIATFRAALHVCPGHLYSWLSLIPNTATQNGCRNIILKDLFQQPIENILRIIRQLDTDTKKQLLTSLHAVSNPGNISKIIDVILELHGAVSASYNAISRLACQIKNVGMHHALGCLRQLHGTSTGFEYFFKSIALSMNDLTYLKELETFCRGDLKEHDVLRSVLAHATAPIDLPTSIRQITEISDPSKKAKTAGLCLVRASSSPLFIEAFLQLDTADQDMLLCNFFQRKAHIGNDKVMKKLHALMQRLIFMAPKRAFECFHHIQDERQLHSVLQVTFSKLSNKPVAEIMATIQVMPPQWRLPAVLGMLSTTPSESLQSLQQGINNYLSDTDKLELDHAIRIQLLRSRKDLLREMLLGIHESDIQRQAIDRLLSAARCEEELEFLAGFISLLPNECKAAMQIRYCSILAHFNLMAAIQKSSVIDNKKLVMEFFLTLFLRIAKREGGADVFLTFDEDTIEQLVHAYFTYESTIEAEDIDEVIYMLGDLAVKNLALFCHMIWHIPDAEVQERYVKLTFGQLAESSETKAQIISQLAPPWSEWAMLGVIQDLSIWDIGSAIKMADAFSQENLILRQRLLQKAFNTVMRIQPEAILAFRVCEECERHTLVEKYKEKSEFGLDEYGDLVNQLLK